MSVESYRSRLDRKREQRTAAERKVGEYRTKESQKRSEADRARTAASNTKSATTARSKAKEAERKDKEAAAAGKEASQWQTKASRYAKEESALAQSLARAQRSADDEAERRRRREAQRSARETARDRALLEERLGQAEAAVNQVAQSLREPRAEKLRVLILGASSLGDLRIGREQKRIRNAVESALHRDLVELDVRTAATPADLLDGISKFRPHVVHFSGHSDEELIVFEEERDAPHEGIAVTARAFARALEATDDPPTLVLLNSCNSAPQARALAEQGLIPFAIGMSDEIGDGDAINYAAQFYASLANGQSVRSAHLSGQAALELAGLSGADLPTLYSTEDLDPSAALLVAPPEGS